MPTVNDGMPVPGKDRIRWYKVIYPSMSQKIRATILAPTFLGELVHWDQRSLGCSRDQYCAHCNAGLPKKWAGYIAIFSHGLKERAILGLTEASARDLLGLQDKYGSLRGVTVELARVNPKNRRSRVGVYEIGRQEPHEVMPEHPILHSLNRLWSMNGEWVAARESSGMVPEPGSRNVGVPLDQSEWEDQHDRPTEEQRRRLKEALSGIGSFKSEVI